jgi:hypothetical protein
MSDASPATTLRKVLGWVLLVAGVAVFAIRLHHPGPYQAPGGGNLRAGVLSLLIGAWLARDGWRGPFATRLTMISVVAGPIVLFFALYAVFAELEETVTLRITHPAGRSADLRLWIVDRDGVEWVTMPRAKADANGLTESRAELLRDGAWRCVFARRDESRDVVNAIHHLRMEKYAVQRLGRLLGMFGDEAGETTVALRLDPCPDG